MIDQAAFDDVADSLVADGVRVTYESLREALGTSNRHRLGSEHGTSHSARDIQYPFADWKRRRRYKPHLAMHDLSDEAEKAVAASLDALRRAADRLPPGMPPMVSQADLAEVLTQIEDISQRLGSRLDTLTAENAALRKDLTAAIAAKRVQGDRVIRRGRKSGVFDSTSRHFWNRLMLTFHDHIKSGGPKSVQDLLGLVDDDTHALAALAFEAIDETILREKLSVRVGRRHYFELKDGLYHILPSGPRKPVRNSKGRKRMAGGGAVRGRD